MTEKLAHYRDPSTQRDSREQIPDIDAEVLRFAEDIIRGDEPSTTLGVLVQHKRGIPDERYRDPRKGMTAEAIAGLIGAHDVAQVEWVLDGLVEKNLALPLEENGINKHIAWAPYPIDSALIRAEVVATI